MAPDKPLTKFAQNMLLIRTTAGATRRNFAKFLGSTDAKIQAYEDGKTHPKDYIINDIAEKIGLPAETLTKKLLTKKDIPMLVVNASLDVSEKEVEGLRKLLSDKDKQVEQQQKLIEFLYKQLEKK